MEKIYFIKLKGEEVPIKVKKFRNSNVMNLYFKGNVLMVSKTRFVTDREVMDFIIKIKMNCME